MHTASRTTVDSAAANEATQQLARGRGTWKDSRPRGGTERYRSSFDAIPTPLHDFIARRWASQGAKELYDLLGVVLSNKEVRTEKRAGTTLWLVETDVTSVMSCRCEHPILFKRDTEEA